jgi:transcriptional regulator with XRE-family HTH domain
MTDEATETHVKTADLRRLRKERGLTQTELATRAGVSLPTVQRAERGDPTVTRATMQGIASGLGVALVEIYDDPLGHVADTLSAMAIAPAWFVEMHVDLLGKIRELDEKLDVLLNR